MNPESLPIARGGFREPAPKSPSFGENRIPRRGGNGDREKAYIIYEFHAPYSFPDGMGWRAPAGEAAEGRPG
jgi:hypothetical protein